MVNECSTNQSAFRMDFSQALEIQDKSQVPATVPWESLLLCLVPYMVTLIFALPRTNIGSKKQVVSIIHRISGVSTLLLPLGLMIYQSIFLEHTSVYIYLAAVLAITINCVFGAFLIPKRVHKFDIPTIRAFVVGVTLGLSFVALSLNFMFGHFASFDLVGRVLAMFSLIALGYAVNDSVQHIYRFLCGPKLTAQLDSGFFFPSKTPREAGFSYNYPSLWYAFITATYEQPADYATLMQASVTPSNWPVVLTVTLTALFGLANLMQIHYVICGHEGMLLRSVMYPKITNMSSYGFLLAATANNFGTFAGTLVVKRQVCTFWGAFFNGIGLLIPLFNILFFMYRFPDESMISSMLLLQCSTA